MADRVLPDWIDAYIKYTEQYESPHSYEVWTALGVLGAACGQNHMHGDVPFDMGNNIYVLLIAKQGRTRKTTALKRGLALLKEVEEVTVSPDSISKEKMHLDISDCQNAHGESNYVVFSGELSAIVKTSGIDTPNFLIAVYDETKSFKNATLKRGEEGIIKPHITFMAATTPNFIKTGFGGLDMRENGLMSRMALVFETKPTRSDPFGEKPDKNLKLKLIHDLRLIAAERPRHPIYFSVEGKELYRKIYMNIEEETTRFSGLLQQFGDTLGQKSEEIGRKLDFLIQELNREVNTI